MKRINNLYEKIYDIDNLILADIKARRGKLRSYGVKKHDDNWDVNLFELQKKLKEKTYQTSKYDVFKIITDNGKEREIYRLPYFPDRICHHAIMNIMEPIWVSIFTHDTYSCIKGRGIHKIVGKLRKQLTSDIEGTKYCLKIDVRKFYPSIDHEILKSLLRKKIKDNDLLYLLDEIIDSAAGVPIGNYLSQFFANLYLAYFDHWIKEELKVKYYMRYADDMIFLHSDKAYLHDLLNKIQEYLSIKLNLSLKSNYQVFPVDKRGIDFVGYVFRHTHVLMRKTIKKRLCRKVAKFKKHNSINEQSFMNNFSPWWGWAKHCDSKNLINKLMYEKSIDRKTICVTQFG